MHNIHTLEHQDPVLWAKVEEKDGEFHIIDGWNLGQWTAEVRFPNINTARTYLAGKWNVIASEIGYTKVEEVKPELTIDEKIVKLARQLARGIILEWEFCQQMDLLIEEQWSQAFLEGNQN